MQQEQENKVYQIVDRKRLREIIKHLLIYSGGWAELKNFDSMVFLVQDIEELNIDVWEIVDEIQNQYKEKGPNINKTKGD